MDASADYEDIRDEVEDGRARITKKRPGHRTGRTHDDDIWRLEQNNRRIRALWEIHKPSIAQVHGNCLAGGSDRGRAILGRGLIEEGSTAWPEDESPNAQPSASRASS